MARHHGPRISKAAETLASGKSSARARKEAARILANHKHRMH